LTSVANLEVHRRRTGRHACWLVLVAVAVGLGLAWPPGARAGVCAPPGNSGLSQYFEVIPGSNCNQAPPGSGPSSGTPGHGHHGQRGALPPGTDRQLSQQGPPGNAVKKFVHSTGTAPSHSTTAGSGGSSAGRSPEAGSSGAGRGTSTTSGTGRGTSTTPGTGRGTSTAPGPNQLGPETTAAVPESGGRGWLSALIHPILGGSSGGGAGILLPLFLAAVLLLVLAQAVIRRRRIGGGAG
jgi:hypothetical protein